MMSEVENMTDIIESIKQILAETPVILFMKGTPDSPQCGFSATAIQILKACGHPFAYVNILEQPEIRAHLKDVTDWPTFPQLIVKGELIGGSDILREMYDEGELQEILDAAAEKQPEDEGFVEGEKTSPES